MTMELTVYISLSVADAKHVLTKSTASDSESGVTASCREIGTSIRGSEKTQGNNL